MLANQEMNRKLFSLLEATLKYSYWEFRRWWETYHYCQYLINYENVRFPWVRVDLVDTSDSHYLLLLWPSSTSLCEIRAAEEGCFPWGWLIHVQLFRVVSIMLMRRRVATYLRTKLHLTLNWVGMKLCENRK